MAGFDAALSGRGVDVPAVVEMLTDRAGRWVNTVADNMVAQLQTALQRLVATGRLVKRKTGLEQMHVGILAPQSVRTRQTIPIAAVLNVREMAVENVERGGERGL